MGGTPTQPGQPGYPFPCGGKGQPPCPPQPADAQTTVIHVPVPEGQVNLLDPAVIAEEVKHGEEQNAAERE